MKPPKNRGASIELDDAFTPSHIKFTEWDNRIDFFVDNESIRIQVYDEDGFKMGMRLPLYAKIALAQMLTQTLNGGTLMPGPEHPTGENK